MDILENYKPIDNNIWQGRVDDPDDINSYRWHQVVKLIDLTKEPEVFVSGEKKGFCFLGFCCDEGVRRNIGRTGTSRGPFSIRKEMANLPCAFKRKIDLFDAGDIYCVDGKIEEAQEELKESIKRIISLNLFPIVLGGGHEISFGHYNGLVDSFNEYLKEKYSPIGIINFDAHFDLRPYCNKANSGTMFLQIADQCKKDCRNFSYFCLGIQKSANTLSSFKTADKLNVEYVLAKDINELNMSDILSRINEYIKRHKYIYLTVCMDVFSSAYAPGVSAPQPFGVYPETGLTLIKYILNSGRVISFDIAEVSPRFDEDNRTSKLAAIIIFALISTF